MCKKKQHKVATNPDNRIHNGSSNSLMSDTSDDYNIQELSLCEHKRNVHHYQEARPETDYKEMLGRSLPKQQAILWNAFSSTREG